MPCSTGSHHTGIQSTEWKGAQQETLAQRQPEKSTPSKTIPLGHLLPLYTVKAASTADTKHNTKKGTPHVYGIRITLHRVCNKPNNKQHSCDNMDGRDGISMRHSAVDAGRRAMCGPRNAPPPPHTHTRCRTNADRCPTKNSDTYGRPCPQT